MKEEERESNEKGGGIKRKVFITLDLEGIKGNKRE